MEPELVVDCACKLGEGPLWHPDQACLYWVDIVGREIHRYCPARDEHELVSSGLTVGGMTLQADGALLLFMDRGAMAVLGSDGRLDLIVEEMPGEGETRFNDVIADPGGRVFAGTMASRGRDGNLYRIGTDGSATVALAGVGTPNGMGFTPDRRGMYFTDSRPREVCLFDYDARDGALGERRVFKQTPAGEGVPDGLTVDTEGCVWSARWDGGCLVRYTPDGVEERRVRFPARRVTSLTFGGDDCRDIYVTTAGGDNRERDGPGAGALFRLRPGIQGVPEFRSRIGL